MRSCPSERPLQPDFDSLPAREPHVGARVARDLPELRGVPGELSPREKLGLRRRRGLALQERDVRWITQWDTSFRS